MTLHRYRLKIFERGRADISPSEFVPVFHEWIRSGEFDELLIDVGDYKHVAGGPGVVLVGLESDYSVNDGGGRWGLVYTRKRGHHSDAAVSLAMSIRRLAFAAARLQDEPAFKGRIRFDRRVLEITFLDRLVAPNTEDGLRVVVPWVKKAFDELLGAGPAGLTTAESDTRRPLRLLVKLSSDLNLDRLAQESGVDLPEEVLT